MEDALVVLLARLRLGQVLGGQRDGFGHAHRDVDLGGGKDLGAVLGEERERERGERLGSTDIHRTAMTVVKSFSVSVHQQ